MDASETAELALRSRSLRPILGIDKFSAGACLELLGVQALRKAEDHEVCVVAPE
jgi:hypothetical protein